MNGGAGGVEGRFFLAVQRVGSVIASFGIDVRLNGGDGIGASFTVKDNDGIDAAQAEQDFGAVSGRVERSARSLEGPHGLVGIKGHDQGVAEGAGLRQIAHVPGVQKVKDAVRKDQPLAGGLQAVAQGPGLGQRGNGR